MQKGHAHKTVLAAILLFVSINFLNTEVSSAIPNTISLSISSETVSLNIAPINNMGTFKKSGASTLSASTTNATGYTLSIAAPANSNDDYDKLINSSDNTAKLYSIPSAVNEENYKKTDDAHYNNTWGYLPSRICPDKTSNSCNSNTLFLPAPTVTGDVIDQTIAANDSINTYTISIGTRIDGETKPGSYSNSFIITIVANPIPYTISYHSNGDTTNLPPNESSSTLDTTTQISSTVPVRIGYNFLGWCDGQINTANYIDSCSGTIYNPNGSSSNLIYTLDQTSNNNNLSLTAMWRELRTIANSTYLQEVEICPSFITEGQIYTLKDSRDNQSYKVAKLKDGKCWMIENLNLAGNTAITCDKTDCSNYTIPTNQGWQSGGRLPASSSLGYSDNNYAYLYNSGNKENCGGTEQTLPCYSYYSWDAATLGSGRNISTENTDAPYSICPKQWKLPTSGADTNNGWKRGDFYRLATAYGSNLENSFDEYVDTFYKNAGPNTVTPHFILAGAYDTGGIYYEGKGASYWSATSAYPDTHARAFYYTSSTLSEFDSADYVPRRYGFSIRCLLR